MAFIKSKHVTRIEYPTRINILLVFEVLNSCATDGNNSNFDKAFVADDPIVVSLTDRDIKLTLMTSSTTLTEGGYKGSGAVWTFHLYTSDDEIDLYDVESEEFVSTIKGNYTGDYTFVR